MYPPLFIYRYLNGGGEAGLRHCDGHLTLGNDRRMVTDPGERGGKGDFPQGGWLGRSCKMSHILVQNAQQLKNFYQRIKAGLSICSVNKI